MVRAHNGHIPVQDKAAEPLPAPWCFADSFDSDTWYRIESLTKAADWRNITQGESVVLERGAVKDCMPAKWHGQGATETEKACMRHAVKCVNEHDGLIQQRDEITAALSELMNQVTAEGQKEPQCYQDPGPWNELDTAMEQARATLAKYSGKGTGNG